MATKTTAVKIKALKKEQTKIRIVGDSPLIVHAWSTKAKRMLPAGKRAAALDGITEKEDYAGPVESFINSLYWITEKPTEYTQEAFNKAIENGAKFGFKAEAIKAAALSGAYAKKWIPNKKNVQGLFFIHPDYIDNDYNQLVEVKYSNLVMREDIVLLSGISHSADLRWRPEFEDWYMDFIIDYDPDGIYSIEDIVNMINVGGYYFGLGEMRPEKGGQYGMFHVDVTSKKARGKA